MNNNDRLTIFPSDKKIKILFLPGWNTKKEIYEELIRSFKNMGKLPIMLLKALKPNYIILIRIKIMSTILLIA